MTAPDYEGIVYDLDGTVVRLAVDWAAARESAAEAYETAGRDPGDRDLWDLLADAGDPELLAAVESAIADHERPGARDSERLPIADELAAAEVPVAVCSLNCEAACRIALETHGLADAVDAVVGRDSMPVSKPDPRPLLEAIARIDRHPARVVFVGDSRRDEETARKAGVDFQYVDGGPGDH